MKRFLKKSLIYFLIFSLFLPTWLVTGALGAEKAKAAPTDLRQVVINEIAWAGSSQSTSDEWIELRNMTAASVDISGWIIQGAATSGGDLTLPATQSVPAGGYYLIANFSNANSSSALDVVPDLVTTSISLSNSPTNNLILLDAGSNVEDTFLSVLNWPAGDNATKASMARNNVPGDGEDAMSWFTSDFGRGFDNNGINKGTPGSSNAPIITVDPYLTTRTNLDITVTASTDHGSLNTASHIFTANGSFTFLVTNLDGMTASEVVTIMNIDKVAPVITLIGDALTTVDEGAAYTDPGATALDDQDGDITSEIVPSGDTIDTAIPGIYIIKYDVSDTAGNTAVEVTRTVAVSTILSDSNKEMILGSTGPTSGAWIMIPEGLTGADIDLNSLIIPGSNPPAALTIRPITMVLSMATGDISITIPAGTTITGPAGWDGKINLPAVMTDNGSLLGSVGYIISDISAFTIGSDQGPLTFSAPVKIVFSGLANQSVGFVDQTGTFTEITTICDDIDNPTNIVGNGECKINSTNSEDLIVYTEHFTEFVTYQKTAVVLNSPMFSVVTSIENNEKYLTISWVGVGGAVEKYEITVNDVKNSVIAKPNDLSQIYSFKLKVSDYGNYKVLVRAWAQNVYSSNVTFLTVTLTAPVASVTTVPVPEETAAVPSIVPAAAKAAEPQPTAVQTPSDNSGVIKGEENTNEVSNKVNWAPWIILFILIVLAGAATGGYFYWFSGKEDMEESGKPIQKSSAPEVVVREKKKTVEQRKTKRW